MNQAPSLFRDEAGFWDSYLSGVGSELGGAADTVARDAAVSILRSAEASVILYETVVIPSGAVEMTDGAASYMAGAALIAAAPAVGLILPAAAFTISSAGLLIAAAGVLQTYLGARQYAGWVSGHPNSLAHDFGVHFDTRMSFPEKRLVNLALTRTPSLPDQKAAVKVRSLINQAIEKVERGRTGFDRPEKASNPQFGRISGGGGSLRISTDKLANASGPNVSPEGPRLYLSPEGGFHQRGSRDVQDHGDSKHDKHTPSNTDQKHNNTRRSKAI